MTNSTVGKATNHAKSHVLGHARKVCMLQPHARSKFTMQMMPDIIPDMKKGITSKAYLGGSLGIRPTI